MTTMRWLAGGTLTATILALAFAPAGIGLAQPDKMGPKDKDPKDGWEKDKDRPKEKGPKGKDGPGPKDGPEGRGVRELRRAYDELTDLGFRVKAIPAKTGQDVPRLLDQARDLYRSGVKAYEGGDRRAAAELGLAAAEVGRGVRHWLRGTGLAAGDLPAPPAGDDGPPDWRPARDELERVRDHLSEAPTDVREAKPALDASRRAYREGREAYLAGDFGKAVELARAAAAWTHVSEHLRRAGAEPPAEGVPVPPRPTDRPPVRPAGKPGDVPPPPPPID